MGCWSICSVKSCRGASIPRFRHALDLVTWTAKTYKKRSTWAGDHRGMCFCEPPKWWLSFGFPFAPHPKREDLSFLHQQPTPATHPANAGAANCGAAPAGSDGAEGAGPAAEGGGPGVQQGAGSESPKKAYAPEITPYTCNPRCVHLLADVNLCPMRVGFSIS